MFSSNETLCFLVRHDWWLREDNVKFWLVLAGRKKGWAVKRATAPQKRAMRKLMNLVRFRRSWN